MRRRMLLVSLSPAAQLVILTGPFVQIGVAQLGLPASLVGGLLALQISTAILRPWLGRVADRLSSGASGRLTWLRRALVVNWLCLPLVLLGLLQLGQSWSSQNGAARLLAVSAEVALMLFVGSANQLAVTLQAALLLESRSPQGRPQALQQLWLSLNGFILLASLLSAALLRQLAALKLHVQLLGVWGLWAALLLLVLTPALSGSTEITPVSEHHADEVDTRQPRQQLNRPFLLVLVFAHAPLYCQEVLLDPWATRLWGWSLANTTTLTGFWAIGTLLGQGWALKWPCSAQRACLVLAALYGVIGLRGLWSGLEVLPIAGLVIALGMASGGLQLWLAGQLGLRCGSGRLGETVGWLTAAVVLSRCAGVAVAGPLLDASGALLGVQSAGAFGLAFGTVAGLAVVGAWSCRLMVRGSGI